MSRARGRRRAVREKCGCLRDASRYYEMCKGHAAEWAERHERARRDHAKQAPRRR